jgi:hypothetical protein
MSLTESEKVVKDTLKRMEHDGDVIIQHNISTAKFSSESIDFHVVSKDSYSHIIEVKEMGVGKLYESLFKDDQIRALASAVLNREQSHTKPWIICRFHTNDLTRRSNDYFEHYIMAPGYYVQQDAGREQIMEAGDTYYLGGMENGETEGIDPEFGMTSQGNDDKGLPKLKEILT